MMLSLQFLLSTAALYAVVVAQPASCPNRAPSVRTTNGTVCGTSLPSYSQDTFLGIPFAEPPVGSLRFKHPQPYGKKYEALDATKQPASCIGFGIHSWGLPAELSEDCLYLNLVRPHTEKRDLPVMLWMYGGGYVSGGVADPQYNASALVAKSLDMDKPVIIVTINYRLTGFGLLASQEVVDDGSANSALYDQRLAMKWVQENVRAFGGDPTKVTIWGESAGAMSAGMHTVAFNGDNEGLFRAAIMQSGGALGGFRPNVSQLALTGAQAQYDALSNVAGCLNATDSLDCLRHAPFEILNQTFAAQTWNSPIYDGKFFVKAPWESYDQGLAADVAVLLGSNTDEGTLESLTPRGVFNTDEDIATLLQTAGCPLCTPDELAELLALYPNDPSQGCPFGTGDRIFPKAGLQYKRGAALVTDILITAGRRGTSQYYADAISKSGQPTYSYRFDQRPYDPSMLGPPPVAVTHGLEIGFVWNNTYPGLGSYIGPYKGYHDLSDLMSRSWIAFAHDLDPNGHGLEGVPFWPKYDNSAPKNMVFRTEKHKGGSTSESDDWRKEPIAWLNNHWEL